MHIATSQCKMGMVDWLLKARADLHTKDGEGFSALTWSCIKGRLWLGFVSGPDRRGLRSVKMVRRYP